MNAIFKPAQTLEAQLEPMTASWLSEVARVEHSAYKHPWTMGNFSDSLHSGYMAQLLTAGTAPSASLIGYFVAMKGVDETHLLNLTVAPAYQRQGWARVMLDALAVWSRGQNAQWLWLEVRASNAQAKAVYLHCGFREVGLRKGYYPAGGTLLKPREDAIVMSLKL
jgi:ribosomal-protein-alanine N-acetyltransferase